MLNVITRSSDGADGASGDGCEPQPIRTTAEAATDKRAVTRTRCARATAVPALLRDDDVADSELRGLLVESRDIGGQELLETPFPLIQLALLIGVHPAHALGR